MTGQQQSEDKKIEDFTKITDHAMKQIDRVRSTYMWAAGIVATMWVIGFTAFGLFLWNNTTEMKQDFRESSKEMKDDFKDASSRLSSKYQALAEEEVAGFKKQAREEIQRTVNEEFSKENISALVQKTAIERIDKVVGAEMDKFESQMTKSLEYYDLVLSAMGDDRPAFEKLRAISGDVKNDFAKQAGKVVEQIIQSFNGSVGGTSFHEATRNELSKVKFDSLKEKYRKSPTSSERSAYVNYVRGRTDFPLKARLQFFIEVMQQDESLMVVATAGQIFTTLTQNESSSWLSYWDYVEWWNRHKNNSEDWFVKLMEQGPQATQPTTAPDRRP